MPVRWKPHWTQWDLLVEKGPDFGYHPYPLKTNLVVREESAKNAK